MTDRTRGAAEGQQLVVAALTAAQPEEPVRQDAALEDDAEFVLDEALRLGPGAGFGVRDEGGRVLLHQAVQRGVLRAMALVVGRDAIRRPLGLPTNGLHDGLPRGGEPERSQAVRRASIALRTADRWEGPPSGVSLWSNRRLQGDEFEAVDVAEGRERALRAVR
jgi:hypothetical protein